MMTALSMIATMLSSTIFQISGVASLTKTRCQMSQSDSARASTGSS